MTWYDDVPGVTQGERIELSARVLANWVAKASNFLVDDQLVDPGEELGLDLPTHWRQVIWALAGWSAHVTVQLGPVTSASPRLIVTDRPEQYPDHAGTTVAIALPGLARSWPTPLPADVIDGAAVLGGQPDEFFPDASFDGPCLQASGESWTGAELLGCAAELSANRRWPQGVRLGITAGSGRTTASYLIALVAAWQLNGSVVLSRGELSPDLTARRAQSEKIDDQL